VKPKRLLNEPNLTKHKKLEIMKKLVTIFALFTLVMLTSFVEPSDIGGGGKSSAGGLGITSDIGGGGKSSAGGLGIASDIGGGGKSSAGGLE
jgi:hypothetical protein